MARAGSRVLLRPRRVRDQDRPARAPERARALGGGGSRRRRQVDRRARSCSRRRRSSTSSTSIRAGGSFRSSTSSPGVVFLVAFVVIPIVSNANIAFTNWSTGHNLTKDEAIVAIEEVSLVAPADGKTYTATPATKDGELVLLLVDEVTRRSLRRIGERARAAPAGVGDGRGRNDHRGRGLRGAAGARTSPASTRSSPRSSSRPARRPLHPRRGPEPRGASCSRRSSTTAQVDTFTNIETGTVYRTTARARTVSRAGEAIEPGWRTHVGFENFSTVLTNPLYRDPFVRVFVWTFAYAAISVFLMFALGLFLAIVLNKPTLKLRRIQRALLVLPFAIPGVPLRPRLAGIC